MSFPMTGALLTWARRLLFAEGASRWVIVAIAVSYFGSDNFIPSFLLSLAPRSSSESWRSTSGLEERSLVAAGRYQPS